GNGLCHWGLSKRQEATRCFAARGDEDNGTGIGKGGGLENPLITMTFWAGGLTGSRAAGAGPRRRRPSTGPRRPLVGSVFAHGEPVAPAYGRAGSASVWGGPLAVPQAGPAASAPGARCARSPPDAAKRRWLQSISRVAHRPPSRS